jgi:hypothetical protein
VQKFDEILLADAIKKAGDAKTSANGAAAAALTAKGASDNATSSASNALDLARSARQEVISAKEETEKLRQQNLNIEANLKVENAKRMELEKTVAPRLIEQITVGNVSTLDVLSKFAGTPCIIEFIPDWEARRAAGFVASVLNHAGWKIRSFTVVEKDLPDGVTVESYVGPGTTVSEPEGWKALHDQWDGGDIIDELVAFLIANDWQAQPGSPYSGELKIGEIRILVGFKPAPYFDPDIVKEIQEETQSEWPNKRAEEIRAIRNALKSESERVRREVRRKAQERQQPKK